MVANRKNKTTSSRNKIAPGAARTANQAPLPVDESLTVGSQVEVQPIEKSTVEPTVEPTTVTLNTEPPIAVIINEPMTSVDMPVVELIVEAVVEPIVESIIEATIVDEDKVDEDKVDEDKPSEIPSTSRNKSKNSTAKSVQRTKGDKIMTQDAAKPVVAKKESAIAVTGSALPVRPVTPNALNFVGMISSAGNRPIGASTVVVFSTYLNGRPIEASSLKLFEMLPGDRPVFANEVSYVAGTADGGRPIMISPAGLMNAGEVMGTRPIFSNDIVDPDSASLMGYLD